MVIYFVPIKVCTCNRITFTFFVVVFVPISITCYAIS